MENIIKIDEIPYKEISQCATVIAIDNGKTVRLPYNGAYPAVIKGEGEASVVFNFNSKSLGPYSKSGGTETVAGGFAFNVLYTSETQDGQGFCELFSHSSGENLSEFERTKWEELCAVVNESKNKGEELYYSVFFEESVFHAGRILDCNIISLASGGAQYAILVDNYQHFKNHNGENILSDVYLLVEKHPELGTVDIGFNASSDGYFSIAHGPNSTARGMNTLALGKNSSAEGEETIAGDKAHSEGAGSIAAGTASHAEGYHTASKGNSSHAEGQETQTIGRHSHAEGYQTIAEAPSAHAEGNNAIASSHQAHAEGDKTTASGESSHAEGQGTTASGAGAHAEGRNTSASGDYSHAEGHSTKALNSYTHAEGQSTTASGTGAHAEGKFTTASGESSHAEGYNTEASGYMSHAEGDSTKAKNGYSHAEGYNTEASGYISHAEGQSTIASGGYSHAEGDKTTASRKSSHAEGYNTKGEGDYSHAEGQSTTASGTRAHAEGKSTTASGDYSHAEGDKTTAWGESSHAEGQSTTASGTGAHAEGKSTTASGNYSHSEGINNTASGYASHVGGDQSRAEGYVSFAHGQGVVAGTYQQAVFGKYNSENEDALFIIGFGSDENSRANAFRVNWDGNCFAKGTFTASTTAADFAEFFEWSDGNPENSDRRGLLVALDGDKIRLANAGDACIGVVSSNDAFTGNAASDYWQGRYITDIFGSIVYEEVTIPAIIDKESGEIVSPEHTELQPITNPGYDPSKEYVPRENRKEWSVVGLVGQIVVIDDGTCVVGGYAAPSAGGIGTNSTTGYRIMKRIDENHVKVLVK